MSAIIDPHHTCHLTRTKRTDLSIWEDENRLQSAGASPRVLLSALAEPEILWFSRVHGELADNLDIIGVHEGAVAADWLELYADPGPVARFIGDIFPVREYVLNEAVAEWIGLDYSTQRYTDKEGEHPYEHRETELSTLSIDVLHWLSCHDECFCNTTPLTDASARRILTQVLKMHSFYLHKDYDWNPVTDEIMSLLMRYKALRLRSHPAGRLHNAVTDIGIPKKGWSIPQWREQNRGPHFELAGCVTFSDDVAQLHLTKSAPQGTDSI